MIDSAPPRRIVTFLLVAALLASAAVVGVAASDYAVSTGSEIDTPTRTVEVEGSQYTMSSVATATVDGSVAISVQVPSDTSYVLDIYNDDEQAVVDTHSGYESQTESIDLSGVEPGTYAITLKNDGNVEAVKPLVVEGVSVSLSVPSEIDATDSLTVTVETASIDGETEPQNVEVAVWNGDETIRVDATDTGSGTYEATVEELAAGDYQVYAAAQGSGTVMGEPNAIGISDGASVTVSEDDGGDSGTPGDSGDGDDGDGQNNDSADDGATGDDAPDDGSEDTDGTGDGETNGDDNETDADLQTPSDPEDDGDDGDSVPFVGPAVLVAPLTLLIGGALRRYRED